MGVQREGNHIDFKDKIKPFVQPLRPELPGIYLGQVQAVFEIPDVRSTDVVELRYSLIGRNPVFGSQSWSWHGWHTSQVPVGERIHEESWHSSRPMVVDIMASRGVNKWLENTQARKSQRTEGEWTTVQYRAVDLRPARFDERQAPGGPQTDVIQASTYKDWAEVETWARALFQPSAAPTTPSYQALLTDLKKHATPGQQALAALRWVQREIRYVSLSLGENTHRPYPPDMVISRRFGDCKDKTMLLLHLLRDLGVEAQPALMLLMDPQAPRLAIPAPFFDHAVAVVWLNGKKHVFDGTLGEQVSDLPYLTPWHAGADLLILDGPHRGLQQAPRQAELGVSRITVNERMELHPNGDSGMLSAEITLEGDEADQTRWSLARNGVGFVKERYLSDIRKAYPTATWVGEPSANDQAAVNKLVLRGVLHIASPLKRSPGNKWRYGYRVDPVLNKLPIRGGLGRVTDLAMSPFKPEVVFKHRLVLPDSWQHHEDSYAEEVNHELFQFRMERRKINPQTVEDEWHLNLRHDRVPKEQLNSYLQAVKTVEDLPTDIRLQAP